MRHKKFGTDPISEMKADLAEIRKDVNQLKNRKVTTLPVYDDPDLFTTEEVVEGQIVVDTAGQQLQFRQNHQWWPGGGCFKFEDLGVAWYQSTDAELISSKTLTGFNFTTKVSDTANRWDATTTPRLMTCKSAGLYAVNYQASCSGTGVVASTYMSTSIWWEVSHSCSPNTNSISVVPLPFWTVTNSGGVPLTFHGIHRQFLEWFNIGDTFGVYIYHEKATSVPFTCNLKIRKLFR